MKDGRYIKILEVEPINFLLRSVREPVSYTHLDVYKRQVAARADVIVPLGAFHAGLAVRAAAGIGVVHAALLAQAAVLADLLGQQAFLALLAGCVAIDAVDDAGIIVVHALVHRTEAGVAQRAVHRVTVIVCAVVAEAAGVADGDGAAGALIAFAAQLVILTDVALGAGGAVLFLHALRALVALLAPIGLSLIHILSPPRG